MEEKIIICPYCGATVPKNWKFCPKCAHLLAEKPLITVLTPPAAKEPDWQESLLEAVEVSYLDESDLEPLAGKTDASSTEPVGRAVDSNKTPIAEKLPLEEGEPSSTVDMDENTSSEETPADGEASLEAEQIFKEPSLDDPLPLEKEEQPAASEPWRKKWRAAAEIFSFNRLFGKKAAGRASQTPPPEEINALSEEGAAFSQKGRDVTALLKKIFLLSPGAPSPSHSFQDKTASLAVIPRVPDAAQKGPEGAKHRTKIVPPPIYLAVERKRNRRIAVLMLVLVLSLGCGAPFFFWIADTHALEASLKLGWSRSEVNERTPYTIALRFEDGVVETYQKSSFYRTEYVLSQKSYAVTSPDTVEIDGKEYKIQLSEDKTVLTMRPALSFYGAKEVWYLRDPEK